MAGKLHAQLHIQEPDDTSVPTAPVVVGTPEIDPSVHVRDSAPTHHAHDVAFVADVADADLVRRLADDDSAATATSPSDPDTSLIGTSYSDV